VASVIGLLPDVRGSTRPLCGITRQYHLPDACKLCYSVRVKVCPAGVLMALKCDLCGKGPQYGNVISHANNTRRRRWNPNLRRVRALVNGARKQIRVCTACIRSGRVKKAA
jgi:large subunit ribosomal protein L28